ncbi:MAG: hypothetical protein ACI4VN_00940 [Clostridia bacterium]
MEEASIGKIVKRFVVKLILWFLLIDIVIGGVILLANVAGWAEIDENDIGEMGDAISSFMNIIIVVNIVAIVGSTLLATRSAKKKYKITEENKKSVFKGFTIAMVVLAIIMGAIHLGVKNIVVTAIMEDTEMEWSDVKEALKDIEKYVDDESLTKADEEMIEMVDSFYGKLNIYGIDWLVFVIMIGVEYVLIVRKEQEA